MHFIGHVSDEELVAFYEIADLFLCASEHEGFCVPLVEAFYKQVPVLAYAATAVPATMDGAGVLYDDKDPLHVAALMDAILSNAELQDAIVDGQLAAVDRLRRRTSPARCCGFVDADPRGAARAGAAVAFDFWEQFDAAEELEELRLYRPSAIYTGAAATSASRDDRQPVGAGGAQGRRDRRQRAARARPAARAWATSPSSTR